MLLITTIFKILKYLEIILSSTATASNSKIFDIEMDPPASSVTTSSPISRYLLIGMSILADVFMLLSCPGCHSIQHLKFFDMNEKKKGLERHL